MKNRRQFISTLSAATAGVLLSAQLKELRAETISSSRELPERKIYIFSKHLQWLNYEGMAETANELGFDGVDLTLRPKGHVLPENVKRDLPKAIRALQHHHLLSDRITTAITDVNDPFSLDILKVAADQGVKQYRLGWYAYDPKISLQNNFESFRRKLGKLEELNGKLGLTGSYQNHAGEMVGGPVWDIGLILEDIAADNMGVRYDIRHATLEGGKSWPLGLKYLADRINSFDIKDFYWGKVNGKWQDVNVGLGKGMVDFKRFFRIISELKIPGDMTLHMEFPIGGAEHGAETLNIPPEEVKDAMTKDLEKLKELMAS